MTRRDREKKEDILESYRYTSSYSMQKTHEMISQLVFLVQSCTATEVPNSDKSATGSLTGTTSQVILINCNAGFQQTNAIVPWTCAPTQQWIGSQCVGKWYEIKQHYRVNLN